MLKPDIIAINETWLDSSIVDSKITLKNYNMILKDSNARRGGLIVYIKDQFTFELCS